MYTIDRSKLKNLSFDDGKVYIQTKNGHELWVRACKVVDEKNRKSFRLDAINEQIYQGNQAVYTDEDDTAEVLHHLVHG